MRGLLITFEGIDGCGKSTQVTLLRGKTDQLDRPCLAVREPGGTPAGEEIREILLQDQCCLSSETELHLYMAARAELVRRIIRPALSEGIIVVCDRYCDSTLAYQGYGSGADINWIKLLNRRVTGNLAPDLTFLLDLPVEIAFNRRGDSTDGMESRGIDFFRRVRNGFLQIAAGEPERFVLIDAMMDAGAQGVTIWEHFTRLLSEQGDLRSGS